MFFNVIFTDIKYTEYFFYKFFVLKQKANTKKHYGKNQQSVYMLETVKQTIHIFITES